MHKSISRISQKIINFLICDIDKPRAAPLSDFDKLLNKIQVCDVILVEGRSRSSHVISLITKSIWTHSALYVGDLNDLPMEWQSKALEYNPNLKQGPLLIESNLGEGVVIKNLACYKHDHLRICRPTGISKEQEKIVLSYAIQELGIPYDNQQIFDLARFFFHGGFYQENGDQAFLIIILKNRQN